MEAGHGLSSQPSSPPPLGVRVLRAIFYGEVLLNLGSGAFTLSSPGGFLLQFTRAETPPVVLEITRWYGVLLLVFVVLEGRALRSRRDDLLTMLIEGFLVGDVIQLAVLPSYVSAGGTTGFAFYMTMGVTVLLMLARVAWLVRYHRGRTGGAVAT